MKSVGYNTETGVIDFSVAQYPAGMPNAGPKALFDAGLKVVEIDQLVGWGDEVLLVRAVAHDDTGNWLPSVNDTYRADALARYWVLTASEVDVFRALSAA